jgi:hypothetical protein
MSDRTPEPRFPRLSGALAEREEPSRERILTAGFFAPERTRSTPADVVLLPVFFTSTSFTDV